MKFVGIRFTRAELVKTLRDREGGSHVDPKSDKRIAAIERSRSRWRSLIESNEDGTQTMSVSFHLSPPDAVDEAAAGDEMNGFVLASMCAIAEEVLFSVTPEPDNRQRMSHEAFRRPLYLSDSEIERGRTALDRDLKALSALDRDALSFDQCTQFDIAKRQLEWAINAEPLTNAELEVRSTIADRLREAGIDWPA